MNYTQNLVEVYLLSLVVPCVLIMSMEGGGSGTPDTTVEPSEGVMGQIQQNTDEGRCLLENPSEILTNAALLIMMYPAAQVLWFSHVVVFSACGSMLALSTCM